MKSGFIKSSWIAIHPTHRMDACFWLKVLEAIKAEQTDINDDIELVDLVKRIQRAYGNNNPYDPMFSVEKKKEHLAQLEAEANKIRAAIQEFEERKW